jgi:hypothetical protein
VKNLIAYVLLLLPLQILAQSIDPVSLPTMFQRSIPLELAGGLKMVELSRRCSGCATWRDIDFFSPVEAPRKERVTVADGYSVMYAYPGSHYFANVKVEQSELNHFDADRDVIERAIKHECQRKLERVESYLSENVAVRETVELTRIRGRAYLEIEEGVSNAIPFVMCTANSIGLIGKTLSQIQLFVPERRMAVTAYLLEQKVAAFKTIVDFRQLRDDFVESYTAYLHSRF